MRFYPVGMQPFQSMSMADIYFAYIQCSTMSYMCRWYICRSHSVANTDTMMSRPNGIDHPIDIRVVQSSYYLRNRFCLEQLDILKLKNHDNLLSSTISSFYFFKLNDSNPLINLHEQTGQHSSFRDVGYSSSLQFNGGHSNLSHLTRP